MLYKTPAAGVIDSWGTVYKYRPFDRNTMSIFLDRELYFVSTQQLNDPLDCQVNIAKALLDALNSFNFTSIKGDRVSACNELKKRLEFNVDDIVGRLEEQIKKYAICSMTTLFDHPLMWSHYGERHTGVCIGFNSPLIRERNADGYDLVKPMPVTYTDENPMVFPLNLFTQAPYVSSDGAGPHWTSLLRFAVENAITTKSLAWEYESEFRYYRNGPAAAVRIEPKAVVEIILGYKMTDRDRTTMLNIINAPEWSHVLVREVLQSPLKPTFKIETLTRNEK